MTTSNTGSPATGSDSTPEERCVRCCRDYRLPATVDPASGRILLPIGGLVRAVTSVAHPGDDVVLPSPEDERLGLWHWICSPEAGRDFPPQSAVIATTRAMATTAT